MGEIAKILTILILAHGASLRAEESLDFYRALAEYHAPAVYQEIGKHPQFDIPTRYDFDGDLFADNNWENANHFDLIPSVYYEVIETQTHFFITYGFYRPRDYTNFWFCLPRVCHENDMEGAILTVRKLGRYGRLEFIEALAHISIKGTRTPYSYLGKSTTINGTVKRAVLRIESGGHGVHVWEGRPPKKFEFLIPSTDSSQPEVGKPPIHYELVHMSELWVLRAREDAAQRTFHKFYDFMGRFSIIGIPSSFAGKKYGAGLASLPWAWGAAGAKKGEWFLDPAYWSYKKLDRPMNFSLEYVHHPYLAGNLAPTP